MEAAMGEEEDFLLPVDKTPTDDMLSSHPGKVWHCLLHHEIC